MCARDERTATESVGYWCFMLKDKPHPNPPPPNSLVRPRVNLPHHLRRKEGLCFLLTSRQVSQKRLFCRTSQLYTRLLEVRHCFSLKKSTLRSVYLKCTVFINNCFHFLLSSINFDFRTKFVFSGNVKLQIGFFYSSRLYL